MGHRQVMDIDMIIPQIKEIWAGLATDRSQSLLDADNVNNKLSMAYPGHLSRFYLSKTLFQTALALVMSWTFVLDKSGPRHTMDNVSDKCP